MIATKKLKDLTRKQMEKLHTVNPNHINGFNKRTSMQSLRDKFNLLGGNFASISFDSKTFKIVQ